MKGYLISELQEWTGRIEESARRHGLDCFPQEFEICDHNQMLGFMAYSGLPSHYPHWSYGKAFERLKTIYDHGVSGLPYEMVINSNPCLGYLMRDNTLLLQILTIAHVFGHNDFFKNNFTFRNTRPELAVDTFKLHADRVREYVEDPSLGLDRVERVLNAAHALAFQCRRNLTAPRLSESEQKQRFDERETRRRRETLRQGETFDEAQYQKALRRTPVEPDEDLLLFIRDHNRHLEEWERDLINIVDEQTRYFIPQIETKIMNEGWASYWHKLLLESLELPEDLHLEFMIRHSQVLAPHKGRVNPYHVGYTLWNSIRIWYDGMLDPEGLRPDERELFEKMKRDYEERDAYPEGSGAVSGSEALFRIRETDRDASFLRRHLTFPLMRELDLFEYRPQPREEGGRLWVVSRVATTEHWKEIRETLIRSVGMNALPVIRVEDSNYRGNSTLLLRHLHDGRDLELESAEKTLQHAQELWGAPVVLLTVVNNAEARLEVDESGRFLIRGAA